MFDNDPFQRSKLYFTIIQLLRIASDWIRESMEDLKSLSEHTNHLAKLQSFRDSRSSLVTASSGKILEQNWKKVIAYQRSIGKPLLDRIERKTEGVKSLRDGVCFRWPSSSTLC